MLAHPTLDQLNTLGLHGLAKGFKELEHKPEARGLEHAEWLGLLLEYEQTLRRQKQFETRARVARLRHPASVEDVDYQSPRGLDRALILKLAACDWIAERRNLLVTGASGLGKSWLACALGHKACRENMSVLYTRMPRLVFEPDKVLDRSMRRIARFLGFLFATGAIVFVVAAAILAAVIWKFEQDLPDYTQLKNYEPRVMTRVHAADGSLLAEYARERRLYLPSAAIAPLVKEAFIAAEDKNFYSHGGFDPDATRWGKAWIVIANHLFLGGRGERPRQMMRQGQDRSGTDARQGGPGLSHRRGHPEIRRRPSDRASPAVRQGDDHESGAPP